MKFSFDLQEQTLKIAESEYWLVLSEEVKFFTQFGGIGFRLDDYNHWINFTLHKEIVQVFYKVPVGDEIIYYRRELTRPTSGIIEFEFTEWDRIEKKGNKWVTKR